MPAQAAPSRLTEIQQPCLRGGVIRFIQIRLAGRRDDCKSFGRIPGRPFFNLSIDIECAQAECVGVTRLSHKPD